MTHSYESIIKLDSERTQGEWYSNGDWNTEPATLGRSVPFSYVYRKAEGLLDCNIAKGVGDDHAANAQYIAAMPDAVGLLKLYKQLLDRAIMGLEDAANSLHIAAVDMELLETKDEEWAHLVKGDDASKRTWARQDDAKQALADIRKQLDGDGDGN